MSDSTQLLAAPTLFTLKFSRRVQYIQAYRTYEVLVQSWGGGVHQVRAVFLSYFFHASLGIEFFSRASDSILKHWPLTGG